MPAQKFKPTFRMAPAAWRGLRLRENFERGGTQVGLNRARQLSEQRDLSEVDVKSMHRFFVKHAVDKNAKAHIWNSDSDPSAGFIAWLLWGSDAGKRWAGHKTKMLDS